MKKDCSKFKIWLDKKGTQFSFVCYESNMVNVNHNTWWIDSGSTIHVSNTLQGMQNLRKPVRSEQCIYSGSKMSSRVAIGTCNLVLSSGFILELEKTFYVPSFSRNLISISRLVPLGFSFSFSDSGFSLSNKSKVIGYGTLSNGVFHIQLQNDFTYNSMHVTAGLKRYVMNEESSMLWHRRLGHISIERIKKLVNDGILSTLDFADFETCVNCINGKQTNKSKKGAKRSTNLLEIIHTDIYCPDMDANSPKYFITFIDDYSRYMYLYLLRSKDEVLDAFKVFKAEVENQYGKHIKIVRSNKGGEYYGKYTENEQAPGAFAKFLQENGIVAQYTMPGSPDQNGVAERRNRTLMDMVRSMRSNTKLPQYLWTETLKTAVYILNRVPTKVVSKTPFESFKGWKPSLRHIRVWGCPSKVRIYNPQEKKLDPRTINGYFIGYAERFKGYGFYCPSHSTRIVESRNAKFLENDLISGSDQFQDIVYEKDHYEGRPSGSSDRLIVINTPQVQPSVRQPFPEVPHIANIDPMDQAANEEIPEIVEQPIEQQVDQQIPQENEATLRRSIRVRKSSIPNDYIVYLQELDYNIGVENDPETFSQAMSSKESNSWYNAMKEEMNSMASNRVWDLVEFSDGIKAIGCK